MFDVDSIYIVINLLNGSFQCLKSIILKPSAVR